MFYHRDHKINWRFFPLFLLVLLLLGTLGWLLLLNYLDAVYFESPERVKQVPLIPFEREAEESGPDEVDKMLMQLLDGEAGS